MVQDIRFDMDKYHIKGLVGDRFLLDNVWYSPNFTPIPGVGYAWTV